MRDLPPDFFTCIHGYHHYGNCPLCGRFPLYVIDDLEYAFEGFNLTIQDKVAIADYLTGYIYD